MNKEAFLHYRTGIDAIDDQHWKLIEDVTYLKRLLRKNQLTEALSKLSEISNDLIEHVALEEQIMADANYPEMEKHRREHVSLLHTLQDVVLLTNTPAPVYWNIITRLHDIFINHIEKYDVAFSEFLKRNTKNS